MRKEYNFTNGIKNPYVNASNKDAVDTLTKLYKEGHKQYKKQKSKDNEGAKKESYERAIKNRESNWENLDEAIDRFFKENKLDNVKRTPKIEKKIRDAIKNKDLKTIKEYEKKHKLD